MVDLNNDGVLDFFSSMHAHPLDKNGYDRMEIGESVPWNFNMDNVTVPKDQADVSVWRLRRAAYRIIIEEPLKDLDPHGQSILDLDGDGILDLIIASGGGKGRGGHNEEFMKTRDNFLFWGEEGVDEITGQPVTIFRGGREAARKAGVHMRSRRGRTNYMLDANGDGLLDIFMLCDRRGDNFLTPGVLLVNKGDRTWEEDGGLSEFTRSMILTDADGDGIADELILNRAYCFPSRKKLGFVPEEILEFCKSRPVGTTAVYKFNKSKETMEEISIKYTNISPNTEKQPPCCPHGSWDDGDNNCNVKSMASGDFDGDLIADLVFLYEKKLVFYLSTDRPRGVLPIGPDYVSAEIELPEQCNGNSVLVADLDNDGKVEIFILCDFVQLLFLVYSQGNAGGKDWILDRCSAEGALGDLQNKTLAGFLDSDYKEACEAETEWSFTKSACEFYRYKSGNLTETKTPLGPRAAGWALFDLNNDGFLDVVVNYINGYMRFFHSVPSNQTRKNRFIAFELVGSLQDKTNRYGVGSTLLLTTQHNGAESRQFREVNSHQHHADRYASKDTRIIFGLGPFASPVSLEVRWPNGFRQTVALDDKDVSLQMKSIVIQQSGATREAKESIAHFDVWMYVGITLSFVVCCVIHRKFSASGLGTSTTHCKTK